MVSEDQLNRIKQLRANGRSHQEIAEEICIPRSTVAYQLKKLKDVQVPNNSIQVIVAQGFEPQATTVSFDPRIFEQQRQNDTLYATGQDLFEMREGIIHKTTLPQGVKAKDYPEIADLIKDNSNWFSLPDRDQLIRDFNARMSQTFHQTYWPSVAHSTFRNIQHRAHGTSGRIESRSEQLLPFNYSLIVEWIQDYWVKLLQTKSNNLLTGMPSPNNAPKLLKYVAKLPKPAEEIIADLETELKRLLTGPKIETKWIESGGLKTGCELKLIGHPPLVIEYFKTQKIIGKENISQCITSMVNTPKELEKFIDSGAGSKVNYEKLQQIKFPDWPTYMRAQEWAPVLHPRKGQYGEALGSDLPPPHLNDSDKTRWVHAWQNYPSSQSNINFRNAHPAYIPLKELQGLENSGWNPQSFNKARELGFKEDEFELFSQAETNLKSANLSLNKENVKWAKSVAWNLEHFSTFPSPKSVILHELIQKSPTSHLRLDSLLEQYTSNNAPGPSLTTIVQLHKLLSNKPFDEICISNLEGGIVERR